MTKEHWEKCGAGRPMLNHHKATEAELRAICGWQYEGKYALYNNVSYEEMKAKK